MTKREITKLAVEAQNILSALEDAKTLYSRLDEITEKLIGENLDGTGLSVTDNFAEKNTAWRSSPFRRYELKSSGQAAAIAKNGPRRSYERTPSTPRMRRAAKTEIFKTRARR